MAARRWVIDGYAPLPPILDFPFRQNFRFTRARQPRLEFAWRSAAAA